MMQDLSPGRSAAGDSGGSGGITPASPTTPTPTPAHLKDKYCDVRVLQMITISLL